MVENDIKSIIPPNIVKNHKYSIFTHNVLSEINLGDITQTISIDISVKLGVMEHIQLVENFSPDEIQTYTALFK